MDAYVSFFAGYSSFLPALFSRICRKPHLIILGGTDCCSFPSFNYGSFRKPIYGWFTCQSLKWSDQLVPVDESLVRFNHSYTANDPREQGYSVFCPAANSPFTVIPIGYDSIVFHKSKPKMPNSFLTVAQMNYPAFFRKGIDLMFEMAHRFQDCQFTLVGHNPSMKFKDVPPNLALIETVSYEELCEYYSTHMFYLQLSVMEGFPSAPCEAMLCECVPIVSGVAALPYIVGDTGFILEKKDPDLLESLIRKALQSPAEQLGGLARQRIIKLFPLQVREKLVEVIKSVMEKKTIKEASPL